MTQIPPNIQSVIDQIDGHRNPALLPRTDADQTRYDGLMKDLFPEFSVANITEFDYGRSYRYTVGLSSEPDVTSLDARKILAAAKVRGPLFGIDVAISAIAPYALVRFNRYLVVRGRLQKDAADRPFNDAQAQAAQRLLAALDALGIHRIDAAIAATSVAGVRTELTDPRDATVADCLFFG
jgi:hypothetical protein